jgi:hypothetical protein
MVTTLLQDLSRMLLDFDSPGWRLVKQLKGEGYEWDPEIALDMVTAVALVLANVWRRIFAYFKEWPWPLGMASDTRVLIQERERIYSAFLEMPLEKLDRGLGRKLRRWPEISLDNLVNGRVGVFLRLLFLSVVPSTSHIENLFAHLKRLLMMLTKAPTMATVSARHATAEFKRIFEARREARHSNPKPTRKSQRPWQLRPVWIQAKHKRTRRQSKRVTGLNVFVGEFLKEHPAIGKRDKMSFAHDAWTALSRARQLVYVGKARAERNVAKFTDDDATLFLIESKRLCEPVGDSPWALGDGRFPYAERKLAEDMKRTGLFKTEASSWKSVHGYLVGPDDADFMEDPS